MSDEMYDLDPMSRAIYDTVREFRSPINGARGGKALAAAMNVPTSTLLNKANPNSDYAHLTLPEARQVMLVSGDHRILHTLAHEVGEACVPMPTLDFPADSDLLASWAEWQSDIGQTAQKMKDVLEDGRVTTAEVDEVRLELMEDFERGLAMLDVLRGMAEPDVKVVPMKEKA